MTVIEIDFHSAFSVEVYRTTRYLSQHMSISLILESQPNMVISD